MLQENIIRYRKLTGLSKKAVAQKLGIPILKYSKLENGETLPSSAELRDLAEIFGVKVQDLVSEPKDLTFIYWN